MNTFWGCETEQLAALSTAVGAEAVRLHRLMRSCTQVARAVTWFGPDAEDHRRTMEDLVETAKTVIELLRRWSELLRQEAAAQDLCSQPDGSAEAGGGLLDVRATPPWHPGPGEEGPHQPAGLEAGPWMPQIGGPLAAEDPTRLADLLPDLSEFEDLGPMIGGPLMSEDPLWDHAVPRGDLPPGESFELDAEVLEESREMRELTLGALPLAGALQTTMGMHEKLDAAFDGAERTLSDSGLEELTPLVAIARTPNDLSGAVLGEASMLGQVTRNLDRGLANVAQTGTEVSDALGEGDLAGAARAGERGLFRSMGSTAELLTATPVPALAETASDLAGNAAALVEPFDRGTSQILRAQEQGLRDLGEEWERGRLELVDPERYYDQRRSALPMPWDPKG